MTVRLLADQNFNGRILRGILHAYPEAEIIRVQDVELSQATDPFILQWAADNHYVVITHDHETMIGYAYQRIESGLPMPGLIVVGWYVPIGQVINDLVILLIASTTDEYYHRVIHLPL